MSKDKKPKLRFPEFTDDWEQRKLGELCERVVRKNKNNESDLPLTISSQNGLIDQRDFFNRAVAAKDMSNYYLLKNGEFAYNKSYSNGYDYGSIKRLNAYEKGCLSTLYICFALISEDVDSDYLEVFFDTLRWYDDISQICAEGARNHGLLNVDTKAFFEDVYINLPSSKQEQMQIAAFLKGIDNLIALHQRKCELLQEYKKGMLQKMFPQNGAKIPEIRFPGFTDDWEQRKLEKHIIEYHEVTTENNQYPVLTSSRKGIFLQTDYYSGNQVASADNTGYNIVPYGYFTYRHMSDDEIFHFNINDIVENGIVSTLYPVFTTDEKLDSRYLQYQLNYGSEFARFAVLQKQGGSRTYMYLNKLKKLSLTMPTSIDEQKKISSFLMRLDNLITLHQRKCEMMQEYKKGLLQQMFV